MTLGDQLAIRTVNEIETKFPDHDDVASIGDEEARKRTIDYLEDVVHAKQDTVRHKAVALMRRGLARKGMRQGSKALEGW